MASRKFFYGDTVAIERRSAPHRGHIGRIDGTLIKLSEDTRRTYYQVTCECGAYITLEASSMDMVGTPAEMPDVPITEMRTQYFLRSIGFPDGTVDSALSSLSQREKNILERRNGLTGENRQTLRDIAKVVGVSHERVRAIEARAMEKLRSSGSK